MRLRTRVRRLPIAMWNSDMRAAPCAASTTPSSAVAISPPVSATALLMPDAAPVCRASTAFKTAVVSGATATERPRAMSRTAGNTRVQ